MLPHDLREVNVVQRLDLVRVPILVRPEEVPIGPAQERAEHDQRDPHFQEAELEGDVSKFALLDGVVTISQRI